LGIRKIFWQGALFGLIEISAVIGFIAALGSYQFGSLAIHGVKCLTGLCSGSVFVIVCAFMKSSRSADIRIRTDAGRRVLAAALLYPSRSD